MAISNVYRRRFSRLADETALAKTQLANEMQINYAAFASSYNYGIIPRMKALVQIADYFEVSVEYLVGNTDSAFWQPSGEVTTFGQRLEELRKSAGIKSVYELAQKTHINKNNIGQWLRCGYVPTFDDVQLLADFFDVSLDYLLGRTDEKKLGEKAEDEE